MAINKYYKWCQEHPVMVVAAFVGCVLLIAGVMNLVGLIF